MKTALEIFENKFGIPLDDVIAIPSVPVKFIIKLMEEYAEQFKLNIPAVTSSYATKLTDYEVNKMKELKSNTVRFTSGGGIGVGVECLVDDKWVDITDYNCW